MWTPNLGCLLKYLHYGITSLFFALPDDRLYSLFSDVIVAQGESHLSLCELSKGAWVPVVNLSSHKFVPLHGLAVLMTLQEHFGRLKGLTMGWVGPMGCKLNTLIYLLPKVGINLRYNSAPQPVRSWKTNVYSRTRLSRTNLEEGIRTINLFGL